MSLLSSPSTRQGVTSVRLRRSPFALDALPAVSAAYSLRRLLGAYAGAAVRVRRSSDNTEQDIGFNTLGNLDTAALLAFTGAGNGFVTTWYDQSTNSRNVAQATAGSQPQIVSSGVVSTLSGRPTVIFNGTTHRLANSSPFMYAAGSATCSVVVSGSAGQVVCRIAAEGNTGNDSPIYGFETGSTGVTGSMSAYIRTDAGTPTFEHAALTPATAFNASPHVLVWEDSGSGITGYVDSAAGTPVAYTRSGAITLNTFTIGALGRIATSQFFAGSISAVVMHTPVLSAADRASLSAGQSSYYGIAVT